MTALPALALAAWVAASSTAPDATGDAAPRFEAVPLRIDATERSPELRFPFRARGDRALVRARVVLTVDPTASTAFPGLEVLVNDRSFGEIAKDGGGTRTFEVPGEALGDRNTLALRLSGAHDACAPAPAGAWRVLRAGAIELATVAQELPPDLGLLPLPFVDAEVDREAEVAVVLPSFDPGAIRAGAVVAGWLGLVGGVPLRFHALPALPPGDAIVLIDGAEAAARLGLPAPRGRAVRVVPNPRAPDARLLVVEA
ncbi:MAG TPA: cellulose biosynthesis cyclic di-GMP-binding regulatory protein BcsB, partial [Anaeromyxobacteraceae bacterium]|nr:cellulose biosynthesis cyclic di-GMP-binding regulatory protein BcsB [Anaeromyxobacteraceae bacterium]